MPDCPSFIHLGSSALFCFVLFCFGLPGHCIGGGDCIPLARRSYHERFVSSLPAIATLTSSVGSSPWFRKDSSVVSSRSAVAAASGAFSCVCDWLGFKQQNTLKVMASMAATSTAFHATTAANGFATAASCRSVSLGFVAASGLRGLSLSRRNGSVSLESDGAMRAMPGLQVRADSSAGAAATGAPKSGLSTFKVAVLGASGGIGQPLSLLIKMSPLVGELRLYDIANVKGVAADLSHCNTPAQVSAYTGAGELAAALKDVDLVIIPAGVPRKPGMTRDDLFNINAGIVRSLVEAVADNAPGALINIISNPVNSTVPIAAEVLKAKGVYDAKKVFGVTTLDVVRANTFVAQKKNLRLIDVNVPVIGGHAGVTILPLLSKTKPTVEFTPEEIEELTVRIQNAGTEVVEAKAGAGSATLSMAYAAARFAESCMRALDGDSDVYECAYIQSEVTDLPFFATTVKLGKKGVEEILGEDLDGITEYEKKAVDALKSELKGSIEKGVQFAKKQAATV